MALEAGCPALLHKATVAPANKLARIIWAVWTRGTTFNGDDALRFN